MSWLKAGRRSFTDGTAAGPPNVSMKLILVFSFMSTNAHPSDQLHTNTQHLLVTDGPEPAVRPQRSPSAAWRLAQTALPSDKDHETVFLMSTK